MKKKIGDIEATLEVKDEAIKKASEEINRFARNIESLKMHIAPIGSLGLAAIQSAQEYESERLSREYKDSIQNILNSYSASDFSFKPIEPANMPIELRMQYQYQFWMTPIWWIQDLFSVE